ncbi:MAG: hypothetical protein JNM43_16350 [Planctomycetaceae bacterium]|nr:hypothetical protein [Planctomycetaceae bacterium]
MSTNLDQTFNVILTTDFNDKDAVRNSKATVAKYLHEEGREAQKMGMDYSMAFSGFADAVTTAVDTSSKFDALSELAKLWKHVEMLVPDALREEIRVLELEEQARQDGNLTAQIGVEILRQLRKLAQSFSDGE